MVNFGWSEGLYLVGDNEKYVANVIREISYKFLSEKMDGDK